MTLLKLGNFEAKGWQVEDVVEDDYARLIPSNIEVRIAIELKQ